MPIANMLVERQGISFSKGFCARNTGVTGSGSTKDILNEWPRGEYSTCQSSRGGDEATRAPLSGTRRTCYTNIGSEKPRRPGLTNPAEMAACGVAPEGR